MDWKPLTKDGNPAHPLPNSTKKPFCFQCCCHCNRSSMLWCSCSDTHIDREQDPAAPALVSPLPPRGTPGGLDDLGHESDSSAGSAQPPPTEPGARRAYLEECCKNQLVPEPVRFWRVSQTSMCDMAMALHLGFHRQLCENDGHPTSNSVTTGSVISLAGLLQTGTVCSACARPLPL